MIKFIVGFCTIVVGVGAAEGTAPLATPILISTDGTMIMLRAGYCMVKN